MEFEIEGATAKFLNKYHSFFENNASKNTLLDVVLYQFLGKGAFATVHSAQETSTKKLIALKMFSKDEKYRLLEHDLMEGMKILSSIESPFIIEMYGLFDSDNFKYVSLELMAGSSLAVLLKRFRFFDEDAARFYSGQVILGLEYLHHLNIGYGDLKPDNILVSENGYVKLSDSVFMKILIDYEKLCYNPTHLAPEIIAIKEYGVAGDWWAFGVFVFELVAGFSPFYSTKKNNIYKKIMKNKYSIPANFTVELNDLIRKLLEPDLNNRIRLANDIKEQSWFVTTNWRDLFAKRVQSPIPLTELVFYLDIN